MFALSKAADPNQLVHGGQLYWALPFSKTSLVLPLPLAVYLFVRLFADDKDDLEFKVKMKFHNCSQKSNLFGKILQNFLELICHRDDNINIEREREHSLPGYFMH